MTFNNQIVRFFNARCLNKKPRTVQFYRDVQKIILETWHEPHCPVADVTIDDVLFFAERTAHLCPSRWNTIVSALRAVSPQHAKAIKRKPLRSRNFVPPAQSQFENFLDECDRDSRSFAGLVVRFLSLTGMRIEEARKLKLKNVFADRIEVPGEIAKSGKWRTIPILDGLQPILERLRAIAEDDSTPVNHREFVLPQESQRTAITSACKRAGVPKMSYHCFRHYFTTKCIEAGVDIPTVARWLGHQDGGALLSKTYFHLLDSHSKRMAAKVKIAA